MKAFSQQTGEFSQVEYLGCVFNVDIEIRVPAVRFIRIEMDGGNGLGKPGICMVTGVVFDELAVPFEAGEVDFDALGS